MRAAKKRNYHVGGEQLLLIQPTSAWTRISALPDLRQCKRIALDRECRDDGLAQGKGPGWATGKGYVCGVSVAWFEDAAVRSAYFPIRHHDTECFDKDAVARWERDHQKAGVRFAMQNAPYDVGWGEADLGVPVPELVDDTTCMAVMIDENKLSYDLDSIARWRGTPVKNERVLREAASAYGYDAKKDLWRLPARFVGEYAESDAVATLLALESMEHEIRKQKLEKAYSTEMALLPVVHDMRKRGVRVDLDAAKRAYDKFKGQSERALAELSDRLSHTVTIDHLRQTKFLEKVHDEHDIAYPRTVKTGQGSFDKKWMAKHEHWLPRLIIRAKSREEAAEKFIKNYIIDHAWEGRIHASVNQFKNEEGGTRTSRFSYSDPPLQQMPARDEDIAAEVRGCFLPEEEELWADADYSQQEYRLIVHYAAVQKLTKAREAAKLYHENPETDFHALVADWTGLDRKRAKDANFAKAYGAGKAKFALMTGKSIEEASRIMDQYDTKMPFVKILFDQCKNLAERRGYIKLLDGARIHFDMWVGSWRTDGEWTKDNAMADCRREEAERRVADPTHPWYQQRLRRSRCNKALNALIQGGAARQTKTAMVACWRAGLRPILQVHDELCFSVGSEQDCVVIKHIMESAIPLEVPMLADVGTGQSWAEAK